ncbi:hypothetical protein Misp06_01493 [Microbulbifer sp. NBRC 101763]|uniref:outer membrane beta-barrel protein n=1 Tax=Microbulbifer TaxID=48073 RepID=UPI00037830AB|nr:MULTISPECIES: outer membrane beta-barrel protein [Microbulbifer]WHI51847.1 outer membrane beta-barrel protein [Microbulbifer sp. MLAF003]
MEKITKFIVAGILSLLSSAALSEGGYWGAAVGTMNFDFKGVDNPTGVGLRTGYSLVSGWGVEVEYIGSLISGEVEVLGEEVDVDMYSLAGYATYRTLGDIYFKGRLGLLYEDVTVGSDNSDDFGITAGAGIGFLLGASSNFELEYTILEKDVGFLSGAFSYRF